MPNSSIKSVSEQLLPYLVLGVSIALLVGLFILLSYVLVWGLIIGVVLWGLVKIKTWFQSQSQPLTQQKGRIIEHEDK